MTQRNEVGQFEPGNNFGYSGKYDPTMCEQVTKLALLGMTDEEMATFFGVTAQTFYNWQKAHHPFFEAVHAGKDIADAEVAHSLYKKATGITYEVERLRKNSDGDSEIIKLSVYEPPDTAAMKQWLSNRRRQSWSDTVKHELTGSLSFDNIALVPLVADDTDD